MNRGAAKCGTRAVRERESQNPRAIDAQRFLVTHGHELAGWCNYAKRLSRFLVWAKPRSWSMIWRARDVSEGEVTEPLTA